MKTSAKRSRGPLRASRLSLRIESLFRKASELTTMKLNVLVIIKHIEDDKWYEFCNTDQTTLFFDLQAAKEHLHNIESFDINSFKTPEMSLSPPPTKIIKQSDPKISNLAFLKGKDSLNCSYSVSATASTMSTPVQKRKKELPDLLLITDSPNDSSSSLLKNPQSDLDAVSLFVSDDDSIL